MTYDNDITNFEEKVLRVMGIVSEATMRRTSPLRAEYNLTRSERFFDKIAGKEPLAMKTICLLALFLLLFGSIAYFTKQELFVHITLFVYCLILLIWIGVVFAVVASGAPKVRRLIQSPYKPFIESVTFILGRDIYYLRQLHTCDLGARRAVLAYYQNERNCMERRGSAISGSIDRIGLFPALAAVAVLVATVSKLDQGKEFVYVLISVIPFFHMFNFSAIGMYQKMDRVITLLQLSVDLADQDLDIHTESS